MKDTNFADDGRMDTMSLTLALIVIDRLNTTERIDVERENLREAVKVVSAAAKKQVPQRPSTIKNYCGRYSTAKKCPTCGYVLIPEPTHYCGNCGQALDWRCHNERFD